MIAGRLARLACERSRLEHAISTARAVGDSEYAWQKRPYLDALNRRIESLKKVVRPEVLEEAREITNTPI